MHGSDCALDSPRASTRAIVAVLTATLSYGVAASYTKRRLVGVNPLAVAAGSQLAVALLLLPGAALLWPREPVSPRAWEAVVAPRTQFIRPTPSYTPSPRSSRRLRSGGTLLATTIYWGYHDLHAAPLGGGTKINYSTVVGSVLALAVDATNLFLSDNGNIASVPIGGGAETTLAASVGAGSGFAVDGTSIYWTDYYGASVRKVAKGGGAVTVLSTSPNVP